MWVLGVLLWWLLHLLLLQLVVVPPRDIVHFLFSHLFSCVSRRLQTSATAILLEKQRLDGREEELMRRVLR